MVVGSTLTFPGEAGPETYSNCFLDEAINHCVGQTHEPRSSGNIALVERRFFASRTRGGLFTQPTHVRRVIA